MDLNNILQYFNLARSSEQEPVLMKQLKNLENRLCGVVDFLKKKSIHRHGNAIKLNQLPWFLFIGSTGSGKTTLLANSNIKFILNKKITPQELRNVSLSEHCDWWVTSNAVIIDVPGVYITHKPKMLALPNKLWQHFLTILVKYRGKKALSGLVVALSLPELLDKDNREFLAENLSRRIIELQNQFRADLPIYFTITKCDILPGFLEFFSDHGNDELTQAWGVSMPHLENDQSVSDAFSYRFNMLIKRLNEQLIWRLHQERNPYTKLHVKDFPLHVERLKEAFTDLLRRLTGADHHFHLKGVYLTSATQIPLEQEATSPPQIVAANQALSLLQNPVMPKQSYFIKQFILQVLPSSDAVTLKTSVKRNNNIFYALVASMILIIAGIFSVSQLLFFSSEKERDAVIANNNSIHSEKEVVLSPVTKRDRSSTS